MKNVQEDFLPQLGGGLGRGKPQPYCRKPSLASPTPSSPVSGEAEMHPTRPYAIALLRGGSWMGGGAPQGAHAQRHLLDPPSRLCVDERHRGLPGYHCSKGATRGSPATAGTDRVFDWIVIPNAAHRPLRSPAAQACEVDDVGVDRHLPAESKSADLSCRNSRHKARSASVMFLRSARAFWFGMVRRLPPSC